MSSSQLWRAPDQESMRSTLQSCLECLDRHNNQMIGIYREILEIRTHITELLGMCQPEAAARDSGAWDNSVDLQAIIDDGPQPIASVAPNELNDFSPLHSLLAEPQAFRGHLSDLEYDPLESVGNTGSMTEGAKPPICQLSQGLLLSDTSGSANYEPCAQVFLPQHSMYSEGQTVSDSSAGRDQQLPFPVTLDSQHKAKCAWPGCLSVVKKGNLTRHVNEAHRQKVRATCASCGKGFARPYMKKDHVCRFKRRIS
ncbi:hypothetical protein EDB19DRAFT_1904538 [Suillus lakei]|nr:hypothetical protein EDB19DRAFT_1904538 [Suillus lakei]